METAADILSQSASLLELFARQSGQTYDRQQAKRLLSEYRQSSSDHKTEDWGNLIASCGEELKIRIRELDLGFQEAIDLVQAGVPIAKLSVDGNGNWQCFVISENRRGRYRFITLSDVTETWLTEKQLKHRFKSLFDRNQKWLVSQPTLILPEARLPTKTKHNDKHGDVGHYSTFQRLLAFLRYDVSDLWTILIFSLVVGILTLTTPIAIEALVNTVAFGRYVQPVIILSFIVLVFLLFSSTLSGITIYVVEVLQRRCFVRFTEDLAYRIPRVDQTSVDGDHLPELLNRFFDVITVQKSISKLLLDGLAIGLQTIIGMAVLAFYHPFLLGFDIALLISIAFLLFVLGRGAVRTAIGESYAKYRVVAWLQELGRHPEAFKLNQGSEFAIDRADQLAIEWLDARKKHFKIVLRQVVFAFGIYCIATTTLLGLGGWLVINGQLTLGQLVAAELIVILIVRSFTKLDSHLESWYDLMAAMDKLGGLLDLPLESHDRFLVAESQTSPSLSLQQVSLEMDGQVVFKDLNIEIPAASTCLILEPIGAGKSGICQILTGVRQPSHGRVLWNQVEMRELRLESMRALIGVSSEPQVFAASIDQNIRLGRPILSSKRIHQVLHLVGLSDFIAEMPEGVHTRLQTNGSPLSIGQCRLLMLARAVASQPKLLLIDGSLDQLSVSAARQVLEEIQRISECTIVLLTVRTDFSDLTDNSVTIGSLSV